MAIPMQRLGGRALRSADNDDVEREYDRLRDLARAENDRAHQASQRSQDAFRSGDHDASQKHSRESKQHYARRDDYNRQAADYIFRENNAPGKVDGDTIDLHGLYVEEAERILEERIRAGQRRGQQHLHAIVGKGNHSTGHVQKIKPKVEELCGELGLKYRTEENAGRIYINLQGGEPVKPGQHGAGAGAGHGGHTGHGGQPQQQQQQQQQHGNQQQSDMEELVGKVLPKVLRKLEKACCTVM
ncbi:Smr protein/MutS2 [Metarhizium album ARSEF 1941]|uniref:Smr protein/MutS2 n=1 Tax=Metarhizium album (strain ARSEF 1941) TaxID=1081103 RepID=A0A0B2X327_METAS|nr:Smr protein/MutS2 [Metarhizium album ARSEF 1941]KHO00729.1 Smr protein/MutS2 [Metarhizium album ARSEF 1941]